MWISRLSFWWSLELAPNIYSLVAANHTLVVLTDSSSQTLDSQVIRPARRHTSMDKIIGHLGATEDEQRATIQAVAARLGLCCQDQTMWLRELAHQIKGRLMHRKGERLHQLMSFTILMFPEALAEAVFPAHLKRIDLSSETQTLWQWSSEKDVTMLMAPLMEMLPRGSLCAGATRALKTPSERVVRVLARLMAPVEMVHEKASRGVGQLRVNASYCLLDHFGRIHPPKDEERREVLLSSDKLMEIRQEAFGDAQALGNAACPLAPEWWRMLDREDRAIETELAMQRPPARHRGKARRCSGRRAKGSSRSSKELFEVECILAERKVGGKDKVLYLVRWSGYDPTWEQWRQNGIVGEAVESWERQYNLRDTEALQHWKDLQRTLATAAASLDNQI